MSDSTLSWISIIFNGIVCYLLGCLYGSDVYFASAFIIFAMSGFVRENKSSTTKKCLQQPQQLYKELACKLAVRDLQASLIRRDLKIYLIYADGSERLLSKSKQHESLWYDALSKMIENQGSAYIEGALDARPQYPKRRRQ